MSVESSFLLFTISIDAPPAIVWKTLTEPDLMKQWMGDPDMKIEIETTWEINTPVVVHGFHHVKFENRGVVVRFDPEVALDYTHLSSLSRLPDVQENYTRLEFRLTGSVFLTELALVIENFPTESIRKHLEFYWRGTMVNIKQEAERLATSAQQGLST